MRNKATLLLYFICSFIPICGFGQDDPMAKSIKDRFAVFTKTALQEKIYVHMDRSFYLIGETIWFKAYNLDGSTNRFLDISKVAYLEVWIKRITQ